MLTKLINAGVSDNLSYLKAKQIKTFNVGALYSLLLGFIYIIINLYHKRYLLVLVNSIYFIVPIIILYTNYIKQFKIGFLISSILLTLGFTVSSILYHNSMEFFLFLLLTMSLIYKADTKSNYLRSILIYSILFIVITLFNYHYTIYKDMGEGNRVERIMIWLFLQIIFLRYFGLLRYYHRRELENNHQQLNYHQNQLKEKTNELSLSNQQLKEMSDAKEKIFSIIAHDVKSPINTLKGTLDLIQNNLITKEDIHLHAKNISIKLNQLNENLTLLLEWSKSQMQGIKVNAEVFELNPHLIETINIFQQALELKKIKINLSIGDLIFVNADPFHVSLILRILISNAIKFSYENSEINITAIKRNNKVEISIEDHGVGMDENTLKNLFTSIKINPEFGTHNERGTGLGLLLTQEFLLQNNGSITINSVLDKGTTCSIFLPVA
jgi:two-component system sensor histidine kinase/response regulator